MPKQDLFGLKAIFQALLVSQAPPFADCHWLHFYLAEVSRYKEEALYRRSAPRKRIGAASIFCQRATVPPFDIVRQIVFKKTPYRSRCLTMLRRISPAIDRLLPRNWPVCNFTPLLAENNILSKCRYRMDAYFVLKPLQRRCIEPFYLLMEFRCPL